MPDTCEELTRASQRTDAVKPTGPGCEECLQSGTSWVQLRLCLSCGHVGCCDSSPGKHATGHYHSAGHPVMRAYEPGQQWAWCYVHEATLEKIPTLGAEAAQKHLAPPS